MAELIKERACGECTACCRFTRIDTGVLSKPTGVTCQHCLVGAGCQVYDLRPDPCRGYYCGWRYCEFLPSGDRPDKSGYVVEFEGRETYIVLLNGVTTLTRKSLAEFVGMLISNDVPVFASVVGKENHLRSKAYLNDAFGPAVRSRSWQDYLAEVDRLKRQIDDFVFEVDPLAHASRITSGGVGSD